MGFESFRVELRGGATTHAQADAAVRRHPHAKPARGSIPMRGSTYFTIEDGAHVIEVEVSDSPVAVSCRFTLCHPPSVDTAFLGLVRELGDRLGMEANICDDVPPEHAHGFVAERFAEFATVTSHRIATRRAEWVANFGPTQLPATTPEVYENLILPRCVESVV